MMMLMISGGIATIGLMETIQQLSTIVDPNGYNDYNWLMVVVVVVVEDNESIAEDDDDDGENGDDGDGDNSATIYCYYSGLFVDNGR